MLRECLVLCCALNGASAVLRAPTLQPRSLLGLRGGGAHLHAALLLHRGGSTGEEEEEEAIDAIEENQTDTETGTETDPEDGAEEEAALSEATAAADDNPEAEADDGAALLADVLANPAVRAANALLRIVAPLYLALSKALFLLGRALPWDLLQAACGLGMCFCGGSFAASIAAAEAFMMSGGTQAKGALVALYGGAREVLAAHEEDETKDDDGDGVADVAQLDAPALVPRKLRRPSPGPFNNPHLKLDPTPNPDSKPAPLTLTLAPTRCCASCGWVWPR